MYDKKAYDSFSNGAHKIAISNHRIKSIDSGKVTFSYKDYADQGKQKLMTLESGEFLRRFCLHILPPGFRKIRHYGFLSSRGKSKVKAYQFQVGILTKPSGKQVKTKSDGKAISQTRLGYDPDACPCSSLNTTNHKTTYKQILIFSCPKGELEWLCP